MYSRRILLVALVLLFSEQTQATPGDLDAAFGSAGKTYVNFSTQDTFAEGRAMAVQSDSKVVVAGNWSSAGLTHIALTRYDTSGAVDSSFGSGGVVLQNALSPGTSEFVTGIAIQADGKILVGGWNDTNGGDFLVVRYTSGGALDTTFNSTGYNIVNVGPLASGFDRADAIVLQSSGKIVLSGYSDSASGSSDRDMSFARFNTNGTLDTTFGSSGKTVVKLTTSQDRARKMAVLSDDRIVVAGRAGSSGTNQAGLIRLSASGTLDLAFGTQVAPGTAGGPGQFGMTITGFGGSSTGGDSLRTIALQSDGKILAAGTSYIANRCSLGNGATLNVVARFTASGALDTSFNGSGYNVFQIGATGQAGVNDLGVQSDGKVLTGGYTDSNCAGVFDFAAARLNTDGTIDSTYGSSGRATVDMGSGSADNQSGAALDPSGRWLLAGYAYPLGQSAANIAVLRLTSAGVADTTFDSDGKISQALQAGSNDSGNRIARQSDGKIVQVGSTQTPSSSDMAITRYNADGTLDTGFGTSGRQIYSTGTSTDNETGEAVAMQSDGKIVVAGAIATDLAIWRYSSTGAIDTTFGTNGVFRTNFGGGATTGVTAKAVRIQSDGKIVVGGIYTFGNTDAVVVRVTTGGVLDTSFNTTGKQQFSWGSTFDEIYDVALQSDDKAVVVGRYSTGTFFKMAAARFTTGGVFDATFGTSGKVTTSLQNGTDELYSVAIQSDGKIVAAGKSNTSGGTNDFAVVRYTAAGALDTSFNTTGSRVIAVAAGQNDQANVALLRWDDKILLAGPAFNGTNDDLALVLLTSAGALDGSFGTGGVLSRPVANRNDLVSGMLIQPDGKWVLGGGDDSAADFMGARLLHAPHEPRGLGLDAASDLGASSSDRLTSQNKPSFSGACLSGETVNLSVDGTTVAPGVVCSAGNTFSVSPTNALTDGARTIRAVASASGGSSSASAAVVVTIDATLTTPAITSPTGASSFASPVTINGTGLDGDGTITVREGGSSLCTAAATSGSNWSCAVAFSTGSHTVFARQTDAAGNSKDGSSVSFNVVVASTTTASASPNPGTFGAGVTLSATVSGASGTPTGTVQFKDGGVDVGSPQTLSGGVASLTPSSLSVGSHSISAVYSGNATYATSTSSAYALSVGKANQVISFTQPSDHVLGDAAFGVVVSSDSGLALTLSSQTASICTVSGTTVTLVAAGTCTLRAAQAGNTNYNAATNVDRSFSVSKQNQTITFAQPADHVSGDAPFALSASATSALTVSFASQTSGVCTVSGSTVTLVAVGTCTVRASQAGNATYSAAASVDRSFAVAKRDQTISFTQPSDHVLSDAPFSLSASADSGLSVVFASQTPSSCSVSASTVTLLGAGTCTVRASQAGDGTYNAAATVDRSFAIAKREQVITFVSPADHLLGDAPFDASASASSGLMVEFSSQTPSTCNIIGSTVTLLAAGTCTLRAAQGGDASYNAASDVDRSFAIAMVDQSIVFSQPADRVFGEAPFALSATSDAGLSVTLLSLTPSVCSVSADIVTLLAAGTCTLHASQAGDATYHAALDVDRSFSVAQAAQQIVFEQPDAHTLGDAPFDVSATSSVGLSLTLSSSTPAVCTVSGPTVTLVSAGSCTVRASQAGNANYAAANDVERTFTVSEPSPLAPAAPSGDSTSTGTPDGTPDGNGAMESGGDTQPAGGGDESGDTGGAEPSKARGGCNTTEGSPLGAVAMALVVAALLRRRPSTPHTVCKSVQLAYACAHEEDIDAIVRCDGSPRSPVGIGRLHDDVEQRGSRHFLRWKRSRNRQRRL